MTWAVDARISLLLVADAAGLAAALAAGPPAAMLAEAPAPPGPGGVALESFEGAEAHPAACTCCAGRPAAAIALDRLFLARVRGQCPWFDRVVAIAGSDTGRAQVRAALEADAVTTARFRAG